MFYKRKKKKKKRNVMSSFFSHHKSTIAHANTIAVVYNKALSQKVLFTHFYHPVL
jgi:radical SAM superfamily enzyme